MGAKVPSKSNASTTVAGAVATALDFDGTLAPIVDDPAASTMAQESREAMSRMDGKLAAMVIVTGRPPQALQDAPWRGAPLQELPDLAGHQRQRRIAPLCWIEDKGRAVALHTRRASDPTHALATAVPRVFESRDITQIITAHDKNLRLDLVNELA
jgi:trehalose 6-phosphate phosphatase